MKTDIRDAKDRDVTICLIDGAPHVGHRVLVSQHVAGQIVYSEWVIVAVEWFVVGIDGQTPTNPSGPMAFAERFDQGHHDERR